MNGLILRAFGESVPIHRFVFSGGEVQVRIDAELPPAVQITAHIRSSDDLIGLFMLTDAAKRRGATDIDLVIPYLPYARQDRVCALGEALSLRVVADLINAQRYAIVEVWDAHSDVSVALLDRAHNRHAASFLYGAFDARTVLVAPDAGAIKKVEACAKQHGLNYVRADKTRNAANGAITGTVVYSEHIGDADFLIVDDICDGGRTFIELAKKLRPLTNGKVNLYVTHGIFSQGTNVFDGVIDRIFVANPFLESLPANFTQIKY